MQPPQKIGGIINRAHLAQAYITESEQGALKTVHKKESTTFIAVNEGNPTVNMDELENEKLSIALT